MRKIIIRLIEYYQVTNRGLVAIGFPLIRYSGCRQWPSCSEFTIIAIQKKGVIRGLGAGVVRVLKCNPLFRA